MQADSQIIQLGTSETAGTSWTWTMSAMETRTALSALLASKKIQAVDKVYHAIAINGIILCILTHCGTNGTADVTLIFQDIIELDADCSGIAFQKVLCNLRIPHHGSCWHQYIHAVNFEKYR